MFSTGVSWLYISINLFGGINIVAALFLTLLLILFLALFPAVAGLLAALAGKRRGGLPFLLLIAPASWILMEWTRSWLFTGFPWISLGYSQMDTVLSSLAPITGIYGIAWLISLSAGLLVGVFYMKSHRSKLFCASGILLIYFICVMLNNIIWTLPEPEEKQVALIQGAIPQAIKWDPVQKQPTIDLYLELSEPYWGIDLIIWPETSIPMFYHEAKPLLENLLALSGEYDTDFLTGIPMYDQRDRKFYNSVLLLSGESVDVYYKNHLVPFGEYLPLDSLLRPILDRLSIPISDFSAGDDRPLLQSDELNIGISICYEDVFGEEAIRALPEAGLLVNVSNDAWFGDSLAPHQHMQMAQMRAKETGRYMLRATNTGISAVINERGELIAQSPQFQPHALLSRIKTFSGTTPYSRTGNIPVILFTGIIFLLTAARRGSRPLS